jgi:hypothetical protein
MSDKNSKGDKDMEAVVKHNVAYDLQNEIRKLMKSEIKLKAKDGKIFLDKNNPQHVEIYEERD